MKITQEEVTHVANLSKLKFSPEETAEFATTLSKIVDMVELLEEVDTCLRLPKRCLSSAGL